MIKLIFFIFLFLFYSINLIKCVFILPFEKRLSSPENLQSMEDILKNEIYTDIKIGTPIQTINAKISFSSSAFYITGISGYQYDPQKSSTYKKESNIEQDFIQEDFTKGYISSDLFYFMDFKTKEQKQLSSFLFILPTKKNDANSLTSGQLGFKLDSVSNYQQIMNNFKEKKLFNKNVIFIKFFKNDENGILYIGDFPHNFDDNYNSKNYYITKASYIGNIVHWDILFEEILYDENLKAEYRQCELVYDFGGILAPNDYYEFVKNNFFDKLINKNDCKEVEIENNFLTFECSGSTNIKTFGNLIFKSKDLKYNFELNYDDLFQSSKGKYYFLIVFKNNYQPDHWVFGKPFLKKYNFVLDFDKKEIGYYGNSYSNSFDYLWIVVFFLIIIIIGNVYLIYKVSKIKKNKRMVTTELIDNEYFPQK